MRNRQRPQRYETRLLSRLQILGPSLRIYDRNADDRHKSTAADDTRTSHSRNRHFIQPKPRTRPQYFQAAIYISGVLLTRRVDVFDNMYGPECLKTK